MTRSTLIKFAVAALLSAPAIPTLAAHIRHHALTARPTKLVPTVTMHVIHAGKTTTGVIPMLHKAASTKISRLHKPIHTTLHTAAKAIKTIRTTKTAKTLSAAHKIKPVLHIAHPAHKLSSVPTFHHTAN